MVATLRAAPGARRNCGSTPTRPALLLVSGGTTGTPKLIPRTHDDYVYNATASARLCELTSADDVYLVALSRRPQLSARVPGAARRDDSRRHRRVRHRPQPRGGVRRDRASRVTVTALVPALAKLWAQACDWEDQ